MLTPTPTPPTARAVSEVLEELAARCEAARLPLPDRVLNRDIARAVGWGYRTPSEAGRRNPAWFHPDDCRNGVPVIDSLHGTDVWREPLDYVGSLDAAMTLVPEGWGWLVSLPNAKAIASGLLKERTPVLGEVQNGCEQRYTVAAATPALALTAAALRSAATLARETEARS